MVDAFFGHIRERGWRCAFLTVFAQEHFMSWKMYT